MTKRELATPPYRIGIDIGGTFTDLVLIDAHGRIHAHKTPSEANDPSLALFRGLEELAARLELDVSTLCRLTSCFIHGTTVATNILLERKGARVGLLTSAGFRDTLELRRGYRENFWDHRTPWQPVLVPRYLRLSVSERIAANGDVLVDLALSEVEEAAHAFRSAAVEAVAICFLNAYRNPSHEQAAKHALERMLPDVFVCASHEVAPIAGEYERSSTAAVNAYVATRVVPYLERVRERLVSTGLNCEPYFVQSSGGAISLARLRERPAVLALSGPAAGANSLKAYAGQMETVSVVSIEVGGTSCDVTVMESGMVAERSSFRVGDDVISLPAVDIFTVAIGGGTIAGVDSAGLLYVGPRGAGARPGPAAFGLGGADPTVTDAHIVLGRLRAGRYAGGAIQLQPELAQRAIEAEIARPLGMPVIEAAAAIVQLSEQKIRHAVERVTLERGRDPAHVTLLGGGGAGPLHAASVARATGCRRVFIPRLAGVFCAFGMCGAHARHDFVREIGRELNGDSARSVASVLEELITAAVARFVEDGFASERIIHGPAVDLRYSGQNSSLTIALREEEQTEHLLRTAFEERHEREFGFTQPGGRIDIVSMRLTATVPLGSAEQAVSTDAVSTPQAVEERQIWVSRKEAMRIVPVYDANLLSLGATIIGPALIEGEAATTLIGMGDRLRVDATGSFHIEVARGVP